LLLARLVFCYLFFEVDSDEIGGGELYSWNICRESVLARRRNAVARHVDLAAGEAVYVSERDAERGWTAFMFVGSLHFGAGAAEE